MLALFRAVIQRAPALEKEVLFPRLQQSVPIRIPSIFEGEEAQDKKTNLDLQAFYEMSDRDQERALRDVLKNGTGLDIHIVETLVMAERLQGSRIEDANVSKVKKPR